ncbi:MAG: histidinol-phosphate transaminase [Xanthomonadales bacterium]|nr:histidinol-phosphate transaminase [Gammaproteobacteria bacterium]NNE04176.1 histidinol-phosphate transaminase [Xanthomonadales bacterium]NNL94987.1 histidinol-phosphate transaminase [Xanthomonadales bacterium]
MNIEALARPEILAMKPYQSARNSAAADGILLNANEAPHALLEQSPSETPLNRYPPPQPEALRDRMAEIYGVDAAQVLVTRGSDEGIDLLVRVFCRPGVDSIIECPPCFGMYRVAAGIQDAGIISVSRDDNLRIDFDALAETVTDSHDAKLVFLTSPNNPSGDTIDRADLKRVIGAVGERALLILDEAYIEFCDADSAAGLVRDCPNLVVLRTLSKAWAAAGLRCGTVIASPAIIGLLQRVMAPYPLSAPAIDMALACTGETARVKQQRMMDELERQKSRLLALVESLPWVRQCWPGEANFILLKVDDADRLVAHCADHGVRIRNFSSNPGLESCVRLSIGSATEMDTLQDSLLSWNSTI